MVTTTWFQTRRMGEEGEEEEEGEVSKLGREKGKHRTSPSLGRRRSAKKGERSLGREGQTQNLALLNVRHVAEDRQLHGEFNGLPQFGELVTLQREA